MGETHSRLRVLVVDEEYILASHVAQRLCQRGLDALPFSEPLGALQLARYARVDMLICDVNLSAMTGVELALAMRVLCPACKVLLFSSDPDGVDLLEEAREVGPDFALLSGSFSLTDFLERVGSLVNELPQLRVCAPSLTP